MSKIKGSPLLEAIFELKWGETPERYFEYTRDETEFFPGIFSQAIKREGFEHVEQLNVEAGRPHLPFEPKYRFRKAADKWPCFQIGLGVFTANQIGNAALEAAENDEYDWDSFKPIIEMGVEVLDASYPPSGIKGITNLKATLRYQDVFLLGDSESLESFVSNKIKADIHVANVFTDQAHIADESKELRLHFAYETSRPKGTITITVMSAQIQGERGVIIETVVESPINDENKSLMYLINWCEKAHDLQRHTFKTLIQTKDLGEKP